MCAIEAGKRGRRVVVIDHARKPAEKIRISGGGRCNFTNVNTSPANFLSENPRFAISALTRYTPQDFVAAVDRHGIAYHEKTLGQLFCNGSSQQIIDMLLEECRRASVTIRTQTSLQLIEKRADKFHVQTPGGAYCADSFVVASGGLSIPKMAQREQATTSPAIRHHDCSHAAGVGAAHLCGVRCSGMAGTGGHRAPCPGEFLQAVVPGSDSIHTSRTQRPGRTANFFVLAACSAGAHRHDARC